MNIASPVSWLGGKARLAPRIIEYFPEHQTYCEPFGGSAAVLLAKEPSKVEVYNDIDRGLVNLFRVLRDSRRFKRLCRILEATLYARAEFEVAKQQSDDPVEAARRFMVRQRQSFGGKGGEWSYSIKKSHGGVASAIKRWRKGVECLPAVHRRFKDIQIECDDWRTVMSRYDSPETLYFLDPPYHPDTRVSGKYRHELTQDDHRDLIARLLRIRGMAVLSGYNHGTYESLERAGWKRVTFNVPENVSHKRTRRVECLWLSPSVSSRKPRLFFTPVERMREGAHETHKIRVESTTNRVVRAIEKFRASGLRITIADVARATKMSRENLSRKYGHLFKV
jgi:DNA adenine methylase